MRAQKSYPQRREQLIFGDLAKTKNGKNTHLYIKKFSSKKHLSKIWSLKLFFKRPTSYQLK